MVWSNVITASSVLLLRYVITISIIIYFSDSQPGVCVSLGVSKKITGGTLWVQFLSGVCKSTIRLIKADLLNNIGNSDFYFSVHPLEVVPFSEDHLYQRMAAPHSKQVSILDLLCKRTIFWLSSTVHSFSFEIHHLK